MRGLSSNHLPLFYVRSFDGRDTSRPYLELLPAYEVVECAEDNLDVKTKGAVL